MMARLWPRSLMGQMLLAVAIALLLAQGIGALLVYRAQIERREAGMVHAAAFRLISATREPDPRFETRSEARPEPQRGGRFRERARSFGFQRSDASPIRPDEKRDGKAEAELRRILGDQDVRVADVQVSRRDIADDPPSLERYRRRAMVLHNDRDSSLQDDVLIAAVRPTSDKEWITARVLVPRGERATVLTLIGQTLLIYLVLVGAIALILRRITRPLAALTGRLERFAETRSLDGQLAPEGPDDVRRLIDAHNAMEARIAALLDEKDVMLGAIGHDLKTPLAALRVRIESVENEAERSRMAETIEDITRSLDDILSLARVGRPTDPREPFELSALVASVVEEFEDMGDDVELGATERIALPLRSTWLRRALRNLIGNAVRYTGHARVSVSREPDWAVVRIEDDGPGIPDDEIERMMEPFARGDPSRNTETGGAGLGLTLARAIADQDGGALDLVNRRDGDGRITGLIATLRLPLS